MMRRLLLAILLVCAVAVAGCPRPETEERGRPAPPAEETPTPPSAGETPTPSQDTTVWPRIRLTRVWRVQQPTYLTEMPRPDRRQPSRLLITEKGGRVRVVRDGTLLARPFLDISGQVSTGAEQGLLSIAFPPDESTVFYVNYTDSNGDTRVARFSRDENSDVADASSERTVLKIDQPYPNHNGGQLQFGPDGLLYIGMGDGGSAGDPQNNAQNRGSLLGKLLRIDVGNGVTGYVSPRSNPFVGRSGHRPEIWALGLRNPWRFSFDRKTQDLYIADVGQDAREEINFQPASSNGGENYGWNWFEGTRPFRRGAEENRRGLTFPVDEYSHDLGFSVTGGYVYRGSDFPTMHGVYFFADFGSGRVWGLRRIGGQWRRRQLLDTDLGISSFGEDLQGNLYVCDLDGGGIWRIRT